MLGEDAETDSFSANVTYAKPFCGVLSALSFKRFIDLNKARRYVPSARKDSCWQCRTLNQCREMLTFQRAGFRNTRWKVTRLNSHCKCLLNYQQHQSTAVLHQFAKQRAPRMSRSPIHSRLPIANTDPNSAAYINKCIPAKLPISWRDVEANVPFHY
jgi:hypothetical protein